MTIITLGDDSARDLGEFVTELKRISYENEGHAVYVLECTQVYPDDKMEEILRQRYMPRSSAIDKALFADSVFYVGETNDLARRIGQHLGSDGSPITEVFPPKSLEQVEWLDSRDSAKRREAELVEEINNLVGVLGNIADHTRGISEDHIPDWRLEEVRGFFGRSGSSFDEERRMLYAKHLANHETNHGSDEEIREVAETMLEDGLPEIVYAHGM